MTRAADAFVETLHRLGAESELDDEQFGRRAALLAASGLIWERELGPFATSGDVQRMLNVSRERVSQLVKGNRLLALRDERENFRFPLFQFRDGQPVRGLDRAISVLSDGAETPYTIAEWLVTPEPELGGETPIELLQRGDADSVEVAATRYAARLRQ